MRGGSTIHTPSRQERENGYGFVFKRFKFRQSDLIFKSTAKWDRLLFKIK